MAGWRAQFPVGGRESGQGWGGGTARPSRGRGASGRQTPNPVVHASSSPRLAPPTSTPTQPQTQHPQTQHPQTQHPQTQPNPKLNPPTRQLRHDRPPQRLPRPFGRYHGPLRAAHLEAARAAGLWGAARAQPRPLPRHVWQRWGAVRGVGVVQGFGGSQWGLRLGIAVGDRGWRGPGRPTPQQTAPTPQPIPKTPRLSTFHPKAMPRTWVTSSGGPPRAAWRGSSLKPSRRAPLGWLPGLTGCLA